MPRQGCGLIADGLVMVYELSTCRGIVPQDAQPAGAFCVFIKPIRAGRQGAGSRTAVSYQKPPTSDTESATLNAEHGS